MSTFTPGPWVALIRPATKKMAASAMVAAQDSAMPMAIDATKSGRTFDEDAANARLIAAAPNLYAALNAIRAWLCDERLSQWPYMENGPFYDDLRKYQEVAAAALAKVSPC